MLGTGLHAEKLAIEHVRDRRQRMPVLGMDVGECPLDSTPSQSGANVRIVVNVERIVVVDELMMKRLSKHGPNDRDEKNSNGQSDKQRFVVRRFEIHEVTVGASPSAHPSRSRLDAKILPHPDILDRLRAPLYIEQSLPGVARVDEGRLQGCNELRRWKGLAAPQSDNVRLLPLRD